MAAPVLRHRLTEYGKSRIPITKFSVDYKDIFSAEYLYMLLREWLIENGWATREEKDFPEVFYSHREMPNVGKEEWIRWRLLKKPDALPFWRFELDIDIHLIGVKETEFVHKGKKLKADKGQVDIQVVYNFHMDPDKLLQSNALLRIPFMKDYFMNKLYKKRMDELKGQIAAEAMRFQDAIKTYLRMDTYLGEKEFDEFWQKRPPE